MKYFVKFFVVTFIALICTYATAEQTIVYLDMKVVLNNSKAGKGAQDYLQNTFKTNQKKFADLEKALKKEETDLLAKKNILSIIENPFVKVGCCVDIYMAHHVPGGAGGGSTIFYYA